MLLLYPGVRRLNICARLAEDQAGLFDLDLLISLIRNISKTDEGGHKRDCDDPDQTTGGNDCED